MDQPDVPLGLAGLKRIRSIYNMGWFDPFHFLRLAWWIGLGDLCILLALVLSPVTKETLEQYFECPSTSLSIAPIDGLLIDDNFLHDEKYLHVGIPLDSQVLKSIWLSLAKLSKAQHACFRG